MSVKKSKNSSLKKIGWHYNNIFKTAKIGKGTKIGSFCEIGNNVIIGKDCVISSYVFTCEGVEIGNNVFVGPGTIFLNDKRPPSHGKHWGKVIVGDNAVIGGGCVILPNVIIGTNSFIGAGSVVCKSVPSGEIWCGNPARFYKKNETKI